jgi:hypothetical protein
LILALLIAGCTGGVYNIPPKEYQQQVKTLGVLPLLIDGRSTIIHPQGDAIFALLGRAAEGQSDTVVEKMRNRKGYFDVRLIREPSRLLVDELLVKADIDELGQPRGYLLNQQRLAKLCKDAVVDGLLVMTLQSAVHREKRWSRNTFETLTTDYNDIMATASVVAADGRVLWEMTGTDAVTILRLQYPDFDEAYYNKTDAVKLKFISLAGLEKTLLPPAEKEGEKPQSPQIKTWLDKVVAALSPSLFR